MIARRAMVEAQLTAAHYRRSRLVQGGLEITCSLTFKMPATRKSSELLKKYLELFESKYIEPQEIINFGTFNKKDSLATTSECVKVPMPAHQVLPLTAYIFEASYSTSATQASKI